MRGRYQGGSLAGFIIIGVVLALVLVGGLYALNRYTVQQSKEVATDDNKTSDNQSENKSEPAPESKPDPSTPAESSDDANSKPNNQSADKGAESKQLPATGPTDVLTAVVGVTALGFSATHYARSRAYRKR